MSVSIGNVVKHVNIPYETIVSVALWDLPGREEMDLRRSYYKDVDAAIGENYSSKRTVGKCGLGSNPGVEAICGLIEFAIGSLPSLERSFSGYSSFSLSSKTNISNFQVWPGMVHEEPLCGCAVSKSSSLSS